MENHPFIDDVTINISIYREFELPCLVPGDIRKLWFGVPKLADIILAFYTFPLRGSVSRKTYRYRGTHNPYAPRMVYLPTFGWFLGQMLVNIPYMEHLGNQSNIIQ